MYPDDWSVCKLMRGQTQPSSLAVHMNTSMRPLLSRSEKYAAEVENGYIHGKEMDAEVGLGLQIAHETRSSRLARLGRLFICSVVLCGAFFSIPVLPFQHNFTGLLGGADFAHPSSYITVATAKDVCPQAPPIAPITHSDFLEDLEQEFVTEEFRLKAYESLGAAVRIPTVMYDDLLPPGQDSRWDVFADFHTYLAQRFPLIHTNLVKTTVNLYALIYHWQGSDDSLKPILLTAHQDVVPVEPTTVDTWVNPPFSGLYDGEWIWGRGSGDDKSGLISIMTAIETLLEHDFKPTRTIVLAFGIDEERGGVSGATAIRDYFLPTYGKDAFSLLVDEGGGQDLRENILFANPAVAEKGSFNLRIDLSTPGGHSSVPPPHTGIGILALLITQLEAHPHEVSLYRNATYYQGLQCEAEYDPDLPAELRDLVKSSLSSDKALSKLEENLKSTKPLFKAIAGTTQAVDIVHGGVKINALPESSYAIVNHRIAGHSSVGALKAHITEVLSPIASQYNLSVDAFGELVGSDAQSAYGQLVLSDAYGTGLEPAPITPTKGSGPYKLLSGTIRNALGTSTRKIYQGKNPVVAPSISLGNTDTKHYWDLTQHIFRYGHKGAHDSYNGAHTVNEAIRAEGFLEMIRFFSQLILNADETDLL